MTAALERPISAVMSIFDILLGVALLIVFGVLVTGVVSMVRGGEFNERNSNKLMRLRVLAQAVAILLLGLAFLFDN